MNARLCDHCREEKETQDLEIVYGIRDRKRKIFGHFCVDCHRAAFSMLEVFGLKAIGVVPCGELQV